jgi:hypothetical protein
VRGQGRDRQTASNAAESAKSACKKRMLVMDYNGLRGYRAMEEVRGRTKHKAMVRPALPYRLVCVFLFCASASIIAASWWLAFFGSPTPARLPL